jgi:hypothetical protein
MYIESSFRLGALSSLIRHLLLLSLSVPGFGGSNLVSSLIMRVFWSLTPIGRGGSSPIPSSLGLSQPGVMSISCVTATPEAPFYDELEATPGGNC